MNNIHHKLLISVPPEKVYDAITTQEGLAGWWAPDAEAKPEVDTIAHIPFGNSYFKEMKIAELIPSQLVKWVCIKGDNQWIGTTLSFELQAFDPSIISASFPEMRGQMEQTTSDTGTVLTLQHNDWKAYTAMFAECSYTWGQFLRSLKLFCETGKGCPWPNQHR